jgi:hypothetical protein
MSTKESTTLAPKADKDKGEFDNQIHGRQSGSGVETNISIWHRVCLREREEAHDNKWSQSSEVQFPPRRRGAFDGPDRHTFNHTFNHTTRLELWAWLFDRPANQIVFEETVAR